MSISPQELAEPFLQFFHIWDRHRDDDLIPTRSRIPRPGMVELMPNFTVLERRADGDIVIRYFGAKLAAHTETDLTASSLLSLAPEPFHNNLQETWLTMFEMLFALYTIFEVIYRSGANDTFISLHLPMKSFPAGISQVVSLIQPKRTLHAPPGKQRSRSAMRCIRIQAIDVGSGCPDLADIKAGTIFT